MHAHRVVDRFGPFVLDRTRGWLLRDGQRERLSKRHALVLVTLTQQPGVVVSRDTLLAAGWPATQVGDDSLRKVISDLRALFGTSADGESCIRTVSGEGYVWQWPLAPADTGPGLAAEAVDFPADRIDPASGTLDPLLVPDAGPHAHLLDGRLALERLDRDGVAQAQQAFLEVLGGGVPQPSAHAGLATVLFLMMESTRADGGGPDPVLLARARQHALAAWQQAPDSAFAWAALALVRHCSGFTTEAIAAARMAAARDEREWRYHFVLGYVAQGSERLRAASRVLDLSPQNALGHWLAATVFVARRAFGQAMTHLQAGCAMQDHSDLRQRWPGVLPPAGLHLLHGQLLAAIADDADGSGSSGAADALARELATAAKPHLYKREACGNACYTLAVLAWRNGDADGARRWVAETLGYVPRHPFARLLATRLGILGADGHDDSPSRVPASTPTSPSSTAPRESDLMTAALVRAADLSLDGRHDKAAQVVLECMQSSPVPLPGGAWMIPVEPLLHVTAHMENWAPVLALLHARAL